MFYKLLLPQTADSQEAGICTFFFFNVQETPWGIEETSGVQALKMGMTLICTWIATYIYNITNYDGSNRLGGWSKFIQQQEPGPKTIRFLS